MLACLSPLGWAGQGLTQILHPNGTSVSITVTEMNNFGQVVGHANITSVLPDGNRNVGPAYVWDGTMHMLADPDGGGSFATGINDNGDIIGYARSPIGGARPVQFTGTGSVDLGVGTGAFTGPMNNQGDYILLVGSNAFVRNLYTGLQRQVGVGLTNPKPDNINDLGHVSGSFGSGQAFVDYGNGPVNVISFQPAGPQPFNQATVDSLSEADVITGSASGGSRDTFFTYFYSWSPAQGYITIPFNHRINDVNIAGDGCGTFRPLEGGSLQGTYWHNGSPELLSEITGPGISLGAGLFIDDSGRMVVQGVQNSNYYFFEPSKVTKIDPNFTFSGATTVTYDGNPHGLTATAQFGPSAIAPAPTVTYSPDGSTTPPTNAGIYTVTATYPGSKFFNAATATRTLTINKASTSLLLTGGGTFAYDGNPHPVTTVVRRLPGLIEVPGAVVNVSYPGGNPPVNPGTYGISVAFPGDNNLNPSSSSTTIRINNPAPTVQVTGGSFVYDGSPHAATVQLIDSLTQQQIGGGITTTYGSGGSTVPVDVGTYQVTASFGGNSQYPAASGTGSVVITKAPTAIVATGGTFDYDGQQHPATATVINSATGQSDGGVATITYSPGGSSAPVQPGTYSFTATYDGDANHQASSTTGSITIRQPLPNVNVSGGTFVYDGNPHGASASVVDAATNQAIPGAAANLTYSPGGSSAPVAPGTYQVTATFDGNGDYPPASSTETIVILKADLLAYANSTSKTLNGPMPALTGGLQGAVAGDGLSVSFVTSASQSSPVGQYSISPVISDPQGKLGYYNVGTSDGVLSVVFAGTSGILQPVNADGSSVFKQGSTVPAKFKVFDANGASVGTPGTIVDFRIVQIVNGTVSTVVNETVASTTPDNQFRWDGSQWVFNISTKTLTANQTYYFQVTLADGSTMTFRFGLR